MDAEEAVFMELIQTLLKDPAERRHFYQARRPNTLTPSYSYYHSLLDF